MYTLGTGSVLGLYIEYFFNSYIVLGFICEDFIQFISPVVNHRIGIDLMEVQVDTFYQFFFGFKLDSFQYLFGHLTEEAFYEIQSEAMCRRK